MCVCLSVCAHDAYLFILAGAWWAICAFCARLNSIGTDADDDNDDKDDWSMRRWALSDDPRGSRLYARRGSSESAKVPSINDVGRAAVRTVRVWSVAAGIWVNRARTRSVRNRFADRVAGPRRPVPSHCESATIGPMRRTVGTVGCAATTADRPPTRLRRWRRRRTQRLRRKRRANRGATQRGRIDGREGRATPWSARNCAARSSLRRRATGRRFTTARSGYLSRGTLGRSVRLRLSAVSALTDERVVEEETGSPITSCCATWRAPRRRRRRQVFRVWLVRQRSARVKRRQSSGKACSLFNSWSGPDGPVKPVLGRLVAPRPPHIVVAATASTNRPGSGRRFGTGAGRSSSAHNRTTSCVLYQLTIITR